jgi:N-methylhydantoinase A/oxoprolinase/acetone carboxylase beta subunit
MIEIGAGGGSIAQIGALGIVQVGPESAGAAPGPVCYGRGGISPTVTDADLTLGYLDPERFAGGSMRLDAPAARRAIEETLGAPLRMDSMVSAWTVHDVVNETMAAAIKMHVTERGGDPSRPVLVAFGGAGPVHVASMAAKLGIGRVLVPLRAGVLSALGLLLSPAAFDLKRTRKRPLDRLDPAAVRAEIADMKQTIGERLADAAPGAEPNWAVILEVGYIGQGYQVPVPVSEQQLAALTPEGLLAGFAAVYREKYGYYYDDVPAELVNILVAGHAGEMPQIIAELQETSAAATPRGRRHAWSPRRRERVEFTVYDRDVLQPGMSFFGPALIEEASATTVVDCDSTARIDRYGSIEIALPEELQ